MHETQCFWGRILGPGLKGLQTKGLFKTSVKQPYRATHCVARPGLRSRDVDMDCCVRTCLLQRIAANTPLDLLI